MLPTLPRGVLAGDIPTAAYPTAGQGLTLDASGQLPLSVKQTLPGYEIGYDQITAPVTINSNVEATGATVITCAEHAFDGAAVIAHFFTPTVTLGAADYLIVSLFEGVTQIGRLIDHRVVSTQTGGLSGFLRFSPTAGPHTYTVTAVSGTLTAVVGAGAAGTTTNVPAFVRFTRA